MSVPMKKRPIEGVPVRIEGSRPKLFLVPREKAAGVAELLREYAVAEDSPGNIPWREALRPELKAGGEGGLMLRGSRNKAGMTQVELAEKLGTPQGNVAAMENGKRAIGRQMAQRLARVFKTDYRVFL